jgi:hypothetical protein
MHRGEQVMSCTRKASGQQQIVTLAMFRWLSFGMAFGEHLSGGRLTDAYTAHIYDLLRAYDELENNTPHRCCGQIQISEPESFGIQAQDGQTLCKR